MEKWREKVRGERGESKRRRGGRRLTEKGREREVVRDGAIVTEGEEERGGA